MKTISEKLKNCNLKVTPQRIAIYNMLYNTTSHPSAETIYRSLEDIHPSMSLATVYKTLDTFKKSGLIQEINVGEDSFRYDANNYTHAHMVCNCCRRVFDAPEFDIVANLKDEITRKTDFDVTQEQIFFYGTCKDCRQGH